MIPQSLFITLRFLRKHLNYTLINIFGLTLSVTCALFITLYIYDELSFDRFHANEARIYRVIEHEKANDGSISKVADVPFRISTLHDQIPEIETGTKITFMGRSHFTTEENTIKIHEPFVVSQQSFLEIFDLKFIHGSAEKALTSPQNVIINRSTAITLFGSTDVVNKIIKTDYDAPGYQITAVYEDLPANSHLQANMIFALESFAKEDWYRNEMPNDWNSNYFATYLLLKEGANTKNVADVITRVVNQNRKEHDNKTTFELQPLSDVHFHSADITGGFAFNPGDIKYLYIFGAVGIFILLIAGINYINLSTSLSITRGKEVGVKKVAGASRTNLIRQFIAEANVITLFSTILALVLVSALLPQFNDFTGKQLTISFLTNWKVLTAIIAFTFLLGTASGIYPALFLSGFKPVTAIKSAAKQGKLTSLLRQSLVVFQFALSMTLILSTMIAFQQLDYIKDKDLGFKDEALLVLDINSGKVRRDFQTIKNEISAMSVTENVCVSSRVPGEWKNIPQVQAFATADDPHDFYFLSVDKNFLSTFQINLIDGRNITDEPGDSLSIMINESAARTLGLTTAENQQLTIDKMNFEVSFENLDAPRHVKVIGIVSDFHFQSLHQQIKPMILAYHANPLHSIDYFTVRLQPGDWKSAITKLEQIFRKVDAAPLLEYNFLDQKLEGFYYQDIRRGKVFALAAGVSIAIACLGLFSLASFMTEQRTKEFGIRKTLGASVPQIVSMLSVNYLKLVTAGFVIATPVATFMLSEWLNGFAYRIEISWLIILFAFMVALGAAILTVGYKSLTAASQNPIRSLRSE